MAKSNYEYTVSEQETTDALIRATDQYNKTVSADKQIPIEWSSLTNGIATQDPVMLGIISSASASLFDKKASELVISGQADPSTVTMDDLSRETAAFSETFTKKMTDAVNTATGTNYSVQSEVTIDEDVSLSPHGTMTKGVTNKSTWYAPTTVNVEVPVYETKTIDTSTKIATQVTKTRSVSKPKTYTYEVEVPAVYENVTSTVPVTTTVSHTRTVQDVSYSENRSSSSSNSFIPFMRSVTISYSALGLKPTSTYNAYFDTFDVTTNITPALEIVVSSVVGTFDTTTDIGGLVQPERTIANNPLNILNVGDVVKNTSGASGVLLGIEKESNTTLRLFLVNVIGTFTTTQVVTGSISTAHGTIDSITQPTTILASKYGNLHGLFTIPNTPTLKIGVGTKKLLFTTSTISDLFADSFASSSFSATGTLISVQPTITSIRTITDREETYTTEETSYKQVTNRQLVKPGYVTTKTGTRVVTGTEEYLETEYQYIPGSETVTVQTGTRTEPQTVVAQVASAQWRCPVDPLAQSFFVSEESGIYVTGIDLFFASVDSSLPVYVSIIDVVNGYPGQNSIPISEIYVQPYEISVSSNTVTLDGRTYYAADTPTRITFKAPVFLSGMKEYCIYIKSDSVKYNLWTSYIGDNTVNGLGMVASQPTLGSLFKSQNSTTWTTDQYQDLTFNLYRAKFNRSVTGSVRLKNAKLPKSNVQHVFGFTYAGSNKVRITLPNHGYTNGQYVTIEGLPTSPDIAANAIIAGVTYVIKTVGSTDFTLIGAASNTVGVQFTATATGTGNGIATEGTYQGIPSQQLNTTHVVKNAELDFFIIETVNNAVKTGRISNSNVYISKNIRMDTIQLGIREMMPTGTYIRHSYVGTNAGNVKQSLSNALPLNNRSQTDINQTLFVLNPENETNYLSGEASLEVVLDLYTDDDKLTPMIDMFNANVIASGNRIDAPTSAINIAPIDYITVATNNANITVNTTYNSFNTTNAALKVEFAKLVIGSIITVSGCVATANNGNFTITNVAPDGSSFTVDSVLAVETSTSISMQVGNRYRDEITPIGSSTTSKYVTRQLKFANLSTSFKMFCVYNKPAECDIKIYFKTSNSSDSLIHSELKYNELSSSEAFISSNNKNEFTEGNLHIEGLNPFDTLSIKIVYSSTNSNKIPRMRDFRLVALA